MLSAALCQRLGQCKKSKDDVITSLLYSSIVGTLFFFCCVSCNYGCTNNYQWITFDPGECNKTWKRWSKIWDLRLFTGRRRRFTLLSPQFFFRPSFYFYEIQPQTRKSSTDMQMWRDGGAMEQLGVRCLVPWQYPGAKLALFELPVHTPYYGGKKTKNRWICSNNTSINQHGDHSFYVFVLL